MSDTHKNLFGVPTVVVPIILHDLDLITDELREEFSEMGGMERLHKTRDLLDVLEIPWDEPKNPGQFNFSVPRNMLKPSVETQCKSIW